MKLFERSLFVNLGNKSLGLWIMFQSLALRGLLLLVIAILVKADVFVDDDIEAVIIQGKPFICIINSN